MAIAYAKDFPVKTRIARYHNVYGPRGERVAATTHHMLFEYPFCLNLLCCAVLFCAAGTWKGGREKVPAAFCRKAVVSTSEFELWGDGLQTRSFMFIDDCVEGSIRIMLSDCHEPLNLGTDEMINMNDFAKLAMSFEGKDLPIKHIPGPQGVSMSIPYYPILSYRSPFPYGHCLSSATLPPLPSLPFPSLSLCGLNGLSCAVLSRCAAATATTR